jgi:hypothetical protein
LVLGESGDDTLEVYVSWNGDTETRSWWVYLVDGEGVNKGVLGKVARTGFETALKVDIDSENVVSGEVFVVAEARDEEEKVLGRSRATRVSDRGLYSENWKESDAAGQGQERLEL